MSDLVGNAEDRFSHNEAQIRLNRFDLDGAIFETCMSSTFFCHLKVND